VVWGTQERITSRAGAGTNDRAGCYGLDPALRRRRDLAGQHHAKHQTPAVALGHPKHHLRLPAPGPRSPGLRHSLANRRRPRLGSVRNHDRNGNRRSGGLVQRPQLFRASQSKAEFEGCFLFGFGCELCFCGRVEEVGWIGVEWVAGG